MAEETKENAAAEGVDPKLAALRARKVAREAEREKVSQGREIALLELEERFETELGPRGEAFDIVDGGVEGGIVLKLGPANVFKQFQTEIGEGKGSTGKGLNLDSSLRFVAPAIVYPDQTKALDILNRRSGLVFDCATALMTLYGRNEGIERSKR